jgi:hypothetical protein
MPFRGRAEEEEERREAFRLGSHGVSHNHDTRTHRKKNKQTKQTTLDTGDNRRPSTNRQTKFFSSSSGALPVYLIFFLDTFTT